MSEIKCPVKECGAKMRLADGFGECEVGGCICRGAELVVTERKDGRRLLRGPRAFPMKKGDLAIMRNTYFSLTSKVSGEYYDVVYVGFGGKKPREENRAPIDVSRVVAVVRPGWKLKGLGLGVTGRSVEEVIKKAWENREVAE